MHEDTRDLLIGCGACLVTAIIGIIAAAVPSAVAGYAIAAFLTLAYIWKVITR